MTARGCALLMMIAACSSHRANDDGTACTSGAQRCSGFELRVCTDGVFTTTQTCDSVCDDKLGCVLCAPNRAECLGPTSHVCSADGMGFTDTTCNGPGEDCSSATGLCEQPCSDEALANSYLGCEYYPTVTGNMVSNQYSFAVIIANYNLAPATIQLDGGPATPETFDVPAQSVVVKKLPWNTDLKLCNGQLWQNCTQPTRFSARANAGAFHLVSNRPVAVYQFNPLDYADPSVSQDSYTVDASLLFPINVWGTDYRVAAWTGSGVFPGLVAVTAGADQTSVTVTATTPTLGDATIGNFAPHVPQTVVLNAGDVIELGAPGLGDLTGSLVQSDKPVQVIGGHYCANVPAGTDFCDHLEESMIPIRALSTKYIVVPPRNDTFLQGRIEVVRVIATEDFTDLTFDPPQPGASTFIQHAGDYVELSLNDASFVVSGTKKILVAQYMIGQAATSGSADPAMTVTVPTGQYRSQYLFHSPTNYPQNYLDIIATDGTIVKLDGAMVTAPVVAIGTTGWNVIRVTLDAGPKADGNHEIVSDVPFGINVYGYGDYTSFWYPGGLDLQPIIQ